MTLDPERLLLTSCSPAMQTYYIPIHFLVSPFVDHVAFSFLLFLRKLHRKMRFCFQRISSDFIKEASRNDEVSIRDN